MELRSALLKRHLQSTLGEYIGHALVHGPAHNAAGMKVEHRRQIQPAGLRGDVGHIRQPHLIRLRRYKALLQVIRRITMLWIRLGGALEATLSFGHQSGLTHQAHDAVAPTADALLPQRLHDLGLP